METYLITLSDIMHHATQIPSRRKEHGLHTTSWSKMDLTPPSSPLHMPRWPLRAVRALTRDDKITSL